MVTEEISLDERILRIFEEDEDQFYFPVTTQNTARNFVKALHGKGVPYDVIYKEIEEFEHNFSAWRKGLGRIGIGKRIIERINQPLEAVLLSDDEDDLTEILTRIKEKEMKVFRPTNDRVPPITSHDTDDSRVQKVKDSIQKSKDEETNGNRSLGGSSGNHSLGGANGNHSLGGANGNHSLGASDKNAKKELEDSWRERVEQKLKLREENGDTEEVKQSTSSLPNSPKISRTGRVPGAELQQTQPGLVDFRSVLKRRSNVIDDKPPGGAGDRRSMPHLEMSGALGEFALRGSAEHINKFGNDQSKGKLGVTHESTLPSLKAKSEQNVPTAIKSDENTHKEKLQIKDNVAKVKVTETSKERKMEEKEKNTAKDTKDETDYFEKTDLEKEFDTLLGTHDDQMLTPEKAPSTNKAPLAAEEDVTEPSESSDEDETESSSGTDITSESSVEDDLDDENEDDDDDDDDEQQQEASDIKDNYDSDFDEENDDMTKEGRHIAKQIETYKSAQKDGQGYLYIFSDQSSSQETKFKIGASHFPEKRLDQARGFNSNIKMAASVIVSLRRRALQEVQEKLEKYDMEGHYCWYQGPVDDVIKVVNETAAKYPVCSSQC